jgi:hypothetical protein
MRVDFTQEAAYDMFNALATICYTRTIREWLLQNDPKALEQVIDALAKADGRFEAKQKAGQS